MSATAPLINGAIPIDSTGARYHLGFDRWDPTSREGWSILWRASEHGRFVLGEDQSVWSWDARDRIWRDMQAAQESTAQRDHHIALNRMRRALLTIRALDSKLDSEREAARLALQRISTAIVMEWRDDRATGAGTGGARWSEAWFDHPAALYLAVTRDCRCHFTEAERAPFNPRIFAALVAGAFDDFNAGRRPQPPRLRAEDMALLQTCTAAPADAPPALDTGFIAQLREQLAKDIQDEARADTGLTKWRQKLLSTLAPAILGLAATIAIFSYSWMMMTG